MKQIICVICFFVLLVGCTESSIDTPKDLKVISASEEAIEIGWTDRSDNEDGFQIERSTDGGDFQRIYEAEQNSERFRDESVSNTHLYLYRIRAFNGDDQSDYSNIIEVRTTIEIPDPPQAPEELTTSYVTRTSIHLIWADRSDNETHFLVERATDRNFEEPVVMSESTNGFIDGELLPNTDYFYRVAAVNAFGMSAYSNETSIRTLSEAVILPAPSEVVVVLVTQTTLTLNWQDNSESEEGVIVSRALSTGLFEIIATLPLNTTQFEDSGLTADTEYLYRVESFDGGILSESSPIVETRTAATPLNPPAGPADLQFDTVSHE